MNRDGEAWMALAVQAARRAWGYTAPNPAVGCALVKGEQLVALGWHEAAGLPHAEVHALAQAGELAKGSTAYVTLEPCNHHGRTGPCTHALIEAGVERVVIGALDPNPRVTGGGVARLASAGIEVRTGVLGGQCEALLAPFQRAVVEQLPTVHLKMATTLDARVDNAFASPAAITGLRAREVVARARERSDAVLVGVGTVLADNPQLNSRPAHRPARRQPRVIVVDSQLRTPSSARVVRAGTWIYTTPQASAPAEKALRAAGAEVVRLENSPLGHVDLRATMADVARRGLHYIYCEGGPTLAAALLREQLVQRVSWFIAPSLLGAPHPQALSHELAIGGAIGDLTLCDVRVCQLGRDALIEGSLQNPRSVALG